MEGNRLIDNSGGVLTMESSLKECFVVPEIKTVMIATGYWDVPGLTLVADEIKSFLDREGTRLLLLIGKDPYVYFTQLAEPRYKGSKFPEDYIRVDLENLKVKDEYKKAINLLLDYCTDEDDSKIEIRLYRTDENDETQFLHSKCYIFDGLVDNKGYGFVGSSNFTYNGLKENAELNYVETNSRLVASTEPIKNNKTHKQWFLEKWELAKRWNKEFLEQVLKVAPITKAVEKERSVVVSPVDIESFTPYELYIKLLQMMYGDVVDKNLSKQIEDYLPDEMMKLSYQIDAVKRCLSIMREHGGFLLADVVGLGKTIVGALIIKYFLTVPEDDGRVRNVLIVTPPAIQLSWEKTIKMFDTDDDSISSKIDYITIGRIDSVMPDDYSYDDSDDDADSGEFEGELKDKDYGLIIIDESHKFRNSGTKMYESLDKLIQNIGLHTGEYPYIGLLSATPQNNRPNDIKNQIYLFERSPQESTLKKANGGNLERFFSTINKDYSQLNGLSRADREQALKEISQRLRECVLDDILERRTRTDIKKYYPDDIERQGLIFPNIAEPIELKYVMDDTLSQLFYDTMEIIDNSDRESAEYLNYYRYKAIAFLKDIGNQRKYRGRGNRDVGTISNQLARLMQILLVKRLESSFSAFTQSLYNLKQYTKNMIDMWENDTIFICPQLKINDEFNIEAKSNLRGHVVTFEECVKDIRAKIRRLTERGKNAKGQNAEYHCDDFYPEYIEKIREDYRIVSKLYERWKEQTDKGTDPKLDTFKAKLKSELFDVVKNVSGKLVIFSEAKDTVRVLESVVKSQGYRVLAITADERDAQEATIEENFDANYEGEWKDDYDVIITTEVLSEGVNLHRANVILNYDTPWNSTKLMQRIGRINRIASKEPFGNIYIYNFMPSAEGDERIELVRRAHEKLQSFHVLFGEDNKVFTKDEDVYHYDVVKAVEGEESPVQRYVYELKQYKEAHSERYAEIESCDEGWEIASSREGFAYFVVKSERNMRLYIRVGGEGSLSLSNIGMLDAVRVDEDTPRVSLPDDWERMCNAALNTYYIHITNFTKTAHKKIFTEAKEFVVELCKNSKISEDSKSLLNNARFLIDRGNKDIVLKLLKTKEQMEGQNLFKLTQEEIDKALKRSIGKIAENVERTQGKAKIMLATMK